jgi:hypothetical protein
MRFLSAKNVLKKAHCLETLFKQSLVLQGQRRLSPGGAETQSACA